MKLSHRIFIGYFIVVAIAGFFLLRSVHDELRPAVRQSMEEAMVDTANLLAELVEKDVRQNKLVTSDFSAAVDDFLQRRPGANIWGLFKNRTDFRIYVTDAKGIVIYDSEQQALGQDYSQWNDVYLTLKGKYGARSTRTNPEDEDSSIMHVAAPIKNQQEIIGVITVSKPSINVLPFVQLSQQNITKAGIVMFLTALLLGWFFSHFLANSTRQLVEYANQVKKGNKVTLPSISEYELSQLGNAIEEMRHVLEGKEYVEQYVHTLTHEIKSPLAGIIGASELLTEDMPREDRERFLKNIQQDAQRIQGIVDRMLDLARIEQQQALKHKEPIDMNEVIRDILESHQSHFLAKSIQYEVDVESGHSISGDSFLVRQAVNNIIDNAVAFSPFGSSIKVIGKLTEDVYQLIVKDQGEGIPSYARGKIFERFYSLPRPDTGSKSSGLGLSFVNEVMQLHGGKITLDSTPSGCIASLHFPNS